jgi:endonuclease/exonuclease/phosphatase family metal-dependent hydrolase
MKILLGNFNAKLWRENKFKLTIGNGSLHRIINEYVIVKSTIFPHLYIHKYICASPDGKIPNQIDHILIDKRWHSKLADVRSFRRSDCDTDHCPVYAKVIDCQ